MASFDEVDRRLAQVPAALERQLREALEASLTLVEAEARIRAPHDTNRLAGSISHQISGTYPTLVGRVGPSVLYGAPQEFGAHYPARMPPVEALMPWVQRHFDLVPTTHQRVLPGLESTQQMRTRLRRMSRFAGTQPGQAAIRRAAFVLARAIKRRGLAAHPYLQPAYEQNRATIAALFERAGARVIAFLAGRSL